MGYPEWEKRLEIDDLGVSTIILGKYLWEIKHQKKKTGYKWI